MPIMYGTVNPPSTTSNPDSTNVSLLQGKQAELIVSELHGKYYTQAYRNNLYNGTTAIAGVTVPAYNATANVFGIWNPAGNTKNGVLVSLDVGLVSGALILSNWTLSQTLNAGSSIASGQISAFTAGTPQGGNIGISGGNTVRFTPSAATTLATTFLMSLGMSFNTTTTTTNYAMTLHYDFDGKVIVPPNAAVWVTNNAASGAVADITLFWEEVPV
jgi:hypothetical protein